MYEHENEEVAFKVVIYNVALDTCTLNQEIKVNLKQLRTKIDNMFSFVWNSRVDSNEIKAQELFMY